MSLGDADLDEVLLAGAFGTYLDSDARRVNLVRGCPSTACDGRQRRRGRPRLALLSTKERASAERSSQGTEHIRLSGLDEFQKAFVQAMRFPTHGSKTTPVQAHADAQPTTSRPPEEGAMDHAERLYAALEGRPVDRPPVFPQLGDHAGIIQGLPTT